MNTGPAELSDEPLLRLLGQPEAVWGTAFMLADRGRFILAARPLRQDGGRPVLELTSVGGRVEDTDASLLAAGQREAVEEIGAAVAPRPCPHTLLIRSETQLEWVHLDLPLAPVAVVVRNWRTPPHAPWDAANRGRSVVAVFAASLSAPPRPLDDLAGLLWLTPRQVVALARRDLPARALRPAPAALLAEGAELPADTWLRLTDAQEALVLALRDLALPFYRGLC